MHSDWIKMRNNLWTDPRVSRICDIIGLPEAPVIGGLYWLWAVGDEHSVDGLLPGMNLATVSRKTGVEGLGEALSEVGWVESCEEGLRIVRFAEHNGASAKRRWSDSKRKAEARAADKADPAPKRPKAPKAPKQGGKSGGEDPPGFDRFWSAYPRHAARQDAAKAFAILSPDDAMLDTILHAIAEQSRGEGWTKDKGKFIPLPATWLRGKRWEDEPVRAPQPQRGWVG